MFAAEALFVRQCRKKDCIQSDQHASSLGADLVIDEYEGPECRRLLSFLSRSREALRRIGPAGSEDDQPSRHHVTKRAVPSAAVGAAVCDGLMVSEDECVDDAAKLGREV